MEENRQSGHSPLLNKGPKPQMREHHRQVGIHMDPSIHRGGAAGWKKIVKAATPPFLNIGPNPQTQGPSPTSRDQHGSQHSAYVGDGAGFRRRTPAQEVTSRSGSNITRGKITATGAWGCSTPYVPYALLSNGPVAAPLPPLTVGPQCELPGLPWTPTRSCLGSKGLSSPSAFG